MRRPIPASLTQRRGRAAPACGRAPAVVSYALRFDRVLVLMPPISSDALVLRTYKLGETSKVVVLLTRERGKLRAVAKGARGARPRYQSALEPLSEVRVSLYGRQGAELYRLGECELVRSAFQAGARGLDEAMALSYFAELLDAFAQEGEAEDAVYRLALAVLAAVEGGTDDGRAGALPGGVAAEAARHLSAARSLRRLRRAAARRRAPLPPPRPTASCARPAGRPRGRWCDAARSRFLREAFAPAARRRDADALRGAPLEAFHRDLIRTHLERDLRSHRVLRDVAREMRGLSAAGQKGMTLQEIVFALQRYWAERGCLLHQPWDAEVGAGTMHPETFLRVLGPRALEGRLRAALAPARGRPLRREPVPPLQAPAAPGHPQAAAGRHPGPVPAAAWSPSASIPPPTTCASRRTTGSRPRWARGASAGRCSSTGRRSRSSRISSRRAASTSRPSPARSPTASSASRCTCRTWTTSTTCAGRRACPTGACARKRSTSSRATRSSWPTPTSTAGCSTSALTEGWRLLDARRGGAHRAARLRLVPQGLARLQRARRPGRDLGQPARGHAPRHPQAGLRDRGEVRRTGRT